MNNAWGEESVSRVIISQTSRVVSIPRNKEDSRNQVRRSSWSLTCLCHNPAFEKVVNAWGEESSHYFSNKSSRLNP
eukprot:scaffold92141_cov34-Attheya_sp.AAC.1